jgi:hypothetical protein
MTAPRFDIIEEMPFTVLLTGLRLTQADIDQVSAILGLDVRTIQSVAADVDWFKATLIEAGVAIDGIAEEQVNAWRERFVGIWLFHARAERDGQWPEGLQKGPSMELLKLNAALCGWLAQHSEVMLIHQSDPSKMEAMLWLKEATTALIARLQDQKKRGRRESINTRVLLELYHLYIDVTGEKALYDGGEAHQFVKTFAEIDELARVPEKGFADLLGKAERRWKARRIRK